MKRIPPKLQPWFDARKKLALSHATIQMARELGMNPKKLWRLVPNAQQKWKSSLPDFIADCYQKSHGRRRPENIRTLENMIDDELRRKHARREKKAAKKNQAGFSLTPEVQPEGAIIP